MIEPKFYYYELSINEKVNYKGNLQNFNYPFYSMDFMKMEKNLNKTETRSMMYIPENQEGFFHGISATKPHLIYKREKGGNHGR